MNGAIVGNGGGQRWVRVRPANASLFELPKRGADEIELDLSDVERTSRRNIVTAEAADDLAVFEDIPPPESRDAANATSEVDVDDILTAVPVDPTVPFEMRVPDKVHARAARLAAQMATTRSRPSEPGAAPGAAPGAVSGAAPGAASGAFLAASSGATGASAGGARAALRAAALPVPAAPRKHAITIFAAVFGACAALGLLAGVASYTNAPIPASNAHAFKAPHARAKVLATHAEALAGIMVPTVHVDSLPRAR